MTLALSDMILLAVSLTVCGILTWTMCNLTPTSPKPIQLPNNDDNNASETEGEEKAIENSLLRNETIEAENNNDIHMPDEQGACEQNISLQELDCVNNVERIDAAATELRSLSDELKEIQNYCSHLRGLSIQKQKDFRIVTRSLTPPLTSFPFKLSLVCSNEATQCQFLKNKRTMRYSNVP